MCKICCASLKFHKICTITVCLFAIIFVVLGAVLPIILHKTILKMAANNVVMTPETHGLWGMVPGDTKMLILRSFQFFNFQNPYETIFLNETPSFRESIPYDYQEFQNFTNSSFYILPNTTDEVVSFNYWDYMKKLPQGNESDMMTIINLPAFGVWYQLQNSEKFLLSIQTMSQMIIGIETEILDFAVSQGILSIFITSKDQALALFATAGIDANKSNELWEDPIFGWQNATTLDAWVKATQEGLYNDTARMLKDYFHLSYTQMSPLLSSLKLNIASVIQLVDNMYCVNKTKLPCDSRYLAALQWSQQGITMNPPGGIGASKSITSTNSTAEGFPEISYYYSDYFLVKISNATQYQNITFDVNWAYNLLERSGDPKNWLRAPYLMFHQGNLKFLFNQGAIFDQSLNLDDLKPIKERFLLKSVYEAHIFWKYMDYIVMEFAIMSPQNGTRETLGIGAFSSQYFYSGFMDMKDFLLKDITGKSLLANLTDNNMNCSVLFAASMTELNETQLNSICQDSNLHKWNSDSMLFLSDLCLNTYDPIWFDFMNNHSLNKINMFELCDAKFGYMGPLIYDTSKFIKEFYNCRADAAYCSEYEIAIKQWGQSAITLNPLPNLKDRQYKSAFSVSDWNPEKFTKPIEYLGFLNITKLNRSKTITEKDRLGINETIATNLLTFDSLFNPVMASKAFIYYLNNDFQNFTKYFLVENPLMMLNYLRYVILEFGFKGITIQKNVSDLLLGYEDSFAKMMKDTDPAVGGNPSINPKVGFCPNNSVEDALLNPQVMYTGREDHSKVRLYQSVYGSPFMLQSVQDFDGNDTITLLKNPYHKEIQISGSDGFTNKPNLNPETDTFDIFVTMLLRYGTTHGSKRSKNYNGLDGYIYKMDNTLINKNPVYDQNRWNGFINFTKIMNAPVFNSKRHFLDVDEEIFRFINYTASDGTPIVPSGEDDDILLYVEPYTGLSLSAWLKIQTSLELSNNLLFNSTYAMLPIFSIVRGGDIPDATVDSLLGELKLGILFENIISRVICFVVGGILLIITMVMGCKYYKRIKKDKKDPLLDQKATDV